ncbi:alkene reductase [Nocardiopsis lambiniae]|uniref:Alkene reductase n=1 Tax=Nocardiopsis lambiniae TaxID=3075539 RepID=A0ABU2MEB5_9ACTN|nr:alkene reductase [Nocardiopsis sp. DSM 44743]MDT0330967.1 alkene reductase [Nocardiopsis sp. DSM 44743]
MSRLFTPTTLGKIPLANRLVMAPMTRNRATPDGRATALTAEYYAQRAGAGLIITEGVHPDAVGQGFIDTPGLHTDAQVASWRPVTEAVHRAGGRIVAQLMHAGRIGHPDLNHEGHHPVAPSPVRAAGRAYAPGRALEYPVPRELTADDIARTVEGFARAARNAVDAGFDGVEVHAGNGFLLHQFLADNANRRTDSYGGSPTGRSRAVVETVDAVAEAVGADRVGLRISPANPYNDIAESDAADLYPVLLSALPPLAFLHVGETGDRGLTALVRSAWSGSLILNPHPVPDAGPVTPERAEETIEGGLAEAVSLATLFLANPDLPDRIRAGGPYNTPDRPTFYGGDHRGYTDYPALA